MSIIIRGRTNQKGCYVCGKPIQKMGENALILKDSDGRIAFCSRVCADKFDPETAKDLKKKSKSKKKIDSLLMAASKPMNEIASKPQGIEKPAKVKKTKKSAVKPKADGTKKSVKPTKPKQSSEKSKAKKTAAKKATGKKAHASGKPVKKGPAKKAAPSKSSKPRKKS